MRFTIGVIPTLFRNYKTKSLRAYGAGATLSRRLIALACIALMLAGPSPVVWAGATGAVIERARLVRHRLSEAWRLAAGRHGAAGAATGARSKQDDPAQNRFLVTKVRVTPQKVLIYEGEGMQINCMTMDAVGNPVNGVALEWTSVNERVATVDSTGEVTAVSPGQTVVQVTAGTQRAVIPVEVRAGARPDLTDAEWKAQGGDVGGASASAGDSNLDVAFSKTALEERWHRIHSVLNARALSSVPALRDQDSIKARFRRGGQNEFRPTIAQHSSLSTLHSSLIAHHSSLIARRSSLFTHRSSLIAHHCGGSAACRSAHRRGWHRPDPISRYGDLAE